MKYTFWVFTLFIFISCQTNNSDSSCQQLENYLSYASDSDRLTGGVRMIEINTPIGPHKVWTKRVGNNPDIKVLLLHGGPGATHELYECFDSYFPGEAIEYIYYDQLGSYYSDQPSDSSLWVTERFVDELEQVRLALGLDNSNFYLLGQSWGGILAMEYALKYQDNLKGLVVSNMVSSIPEYQMYSDSVLAPQMDAAVLAEILGYEEKEDYANPRYLELIVENYYTSHILRMPVDQWPDPINRTFKHLNPEVYVTMQGPSEFGIKGDARLKNWDISDRLKEIKVPVLTIGAEYDTMDPKHMEWMASEFPNGTYLHCPNGSHLCQFDDQEVFFAGLIDWIRKNESEGGS